MKCKYCNSELNDDALFCDKCGQSVVDSSKNTGVTNKYWTDVDALNDTNEKEYQNAVRKAKAEAKAQSAAIIKKIIIAAVVIVVLVASVTTLNANSQQKLEFVKSDAIGNTYSDTSGSWGMFNGEERDRIIVKIKNENTLTYTRGNYSLRISEGSNGYSTKWVENEIYESRDYEYSFSTSLFGKITLEFNGKSYEVSIDDEDGTISSINFYGN